MLALAEKVGDPLGALRIMGRGVHAAAGDCGQEAAPGASGSGAEQGLPAGSGVECPPLSTAAPRAPSGSGGGEGRRSLSPRPPPLSPPPRVSLQKAGGGLRQWKRVYAALRARSLSLSKERREPGPAAAGAAAAVAGEDEAAPVCIGSCLVDISYSETKRRHVFRLTTADFCEYLFQAEDRDDMLGWIRAIRENSRAEGEVRARPGPRRTREGRAGPGPLSPAGLLPSPLRASVPPCIKWANRSIPGDSAHPGFGVKRRCMGQRLTEGLASLVFHDWQ